MVYGENAKIKAFVYVWYRYLIETSKLHRLQNCISHYLSRKLPVWELRLVPHEVSLGLWERVWGGRGGCQFWTAFAAALRGTDDFQALAFGLFSGKIPGVHSGSVLAGFRGHFRRFMRAFGGGFGHFRRLMRAFGGCFGRVLSSLSADEPVSHALSIVELSSQPVALNSAL